MNKLFGRFACTYALGFTGALSACGGGSSGASANPTSPTPPPPATVTPSGANWSFRTTGGNLRALEGAFNPSGDSVTAVLSPFGGCYNADQDRARFTGTRSGRAVRLRSQPVGIEQVTIDLSGTLSAAGDAFEGVYSITGGPPVCSAGGENPIVGYSVNLTGVWAGTLGTIPAVIDLQMASTPDDSAGYALSGSVTFSNTQCFANATITRRARGRILFPDIVSTSQRLELLGSVNDDLSAMNIDYVLVEGTCPELAFGSGHLVRQ